MSFTNEKVRNPGLLSTRVAVDHRGERGGCACPNPNKNNQQQAAFTEQIALKIFKCQETDRIEFFFRLFLEKKQKKKKPNGLGLQLFHRHKKPQNARNFKRNTRPFKKRNPRVQQVPPPKRHEPELRVQARVQDSGPNCSSKNQRIRNGFDFKSIGVKIALDASRRRRRTCAGVQK